MPRITWPDLPDAVRSRVEATLGGTVVAHRSHPGGFSPGTADRVQTASGDDAFVKAVHPDLNPDTPDIHRAELRVMRSFPPGLPTPALLDGFEVDGWVVLVLEHVDAAPPAEPWTADTFAPVLEATLRLSDALTPTPMTGLEPASGQAARLWAGWGNLAPDPPDDLDPWLRGRLPELVARAERNLATLDGDTLCHFDLRADNILLRPDGEVVFIDWPWACRGARWLDAGLLVADFAATQEDHGATDGFVRRVAEHTGVDPETLVDALVAATGFLVEASRRPSPPGLPTLRDFQRSLAGGLTAWLRASDLSAG
ncbi:MAG TPA: phosphotransferase [Propionibacterium sp.]|nr:phosphotransferase [Propionibacterium sp.]